MTAISLDRSTDSVEVVQIQHPLQFTSRFTSPLALRIARYALWAARYPSVLSVLLLPNEEKKMRFKPFMWVCLMPRSLRKQAELNENFRTAGIFTKVSCLSQAVFFPLGHLQFWVQSEDQIWFMQKDCGNAKINQQSFWHSYKGPQWLAHWSISKCLASFAHSTFAEFWGWIQGRLKSSVIS